LAVLLRLAPWHTLWGGQVAGLWERSKRAAFGCLDLVPRLNGVVVALDWPWEASHWQGPACGLPMIGPVQLQPQVCCSQCLVPCLFNVLHFFMHCQRSYLLCTACCGARYLVLVSWVMFWPCLPPWLHTVLAGGAERSSTSCGPHLLCKLISFWGS
jgi:hypothetical protein